MKEKVKFFIVFLVFLVSFGFSCFLGIKQIQDSKKYIKTIGEYTDYKVYSTSDDGESYSLIFKYRVNGVTYQTSSDFGSNAIPKVGTRRAIYYEKNNPSNAKVASATFLDLLIVIDLILLAFLSVMIDSVFPKFCKKYKKVLENFTMGIWGVLLAYIGLAIYDLVTGTKNIFSFFEMISYSFLLIVPLLFVIVGIYMICLAIFPPKKKKKQKKKLTELEKMELAIEEQEQEEKVEKIEKKVNDVLETISKVEMIFTDIVLLGFTLFLTFFAFGSDNPTSIYILPFVAILFSIFIYSCYQTYCILNKKELDKEAKKKRDKIDNILSKLPTIFFLVFWFGFFGFVTVLLIQAGGYIGILYAIPFTIPFLAIGVYMVYQLFKNKK